MVKFSRILILLIADFFVVNISYIASFLVRFDFNVSGDLFEIWFTPYADNLFQISAITLIVFAVFDLYTSMWRYAGNEELVKIALACALSILLVLAYMNFSGQYMPRGIYVASFVIMAVLVSTLRLSARFLRNLKNKGTIRGFMQNVRNKDFSTDSGVSKVMIIGAGDAGATMINEIKSHPEFGKKVVVVVDDDKTKHGNRIMGIKIAGDRTKIRSLARKYAVREIIIAIPSANNKEIQAIINECNRTTCKIKKLPGLIDIIDGKVSINKLRDVAIEDLLGRDPVTLNTQVITYYLEGKIVMVTGGGGSIGSELCRQIAKYKPRRVIALDIYENSVFELANEIKAMFPELEFEVVIASVRNRERLDEVLNKYKPHVVFHAAAHKHVPLMEKNPKEAVLNNILGTKNMADVSDKHAVEKFVMVSTDKAVNPANVMGATKRAAEMVIQEKNTKSKTRYSAVRFGNVLGSNGSVLPIFRRQIEAGGPVTVTHEEITRYFMTIPEAVQLVIQAGAMAEGGEIFILDMGEPVKIMDLAENVIRLSGYVPGVDVDIAVTGLRPGEKLYEELVLDIEGIEKTAHSKIFAEHPPEASRKLKEMLEADSAAFAAGVNEVLNMSDNEIKSWLKELVPNYTPAEH